MMYLIYFVGPFVGAALAVGAYKLLNIDDASPELKPVPDVAEAPIDEEPVEQPSAVGKVPARKTTEE
jgi:hypothetical protein